MDVEAHLGILVCGAGVFGRNHLRVYRALEGEAIPVRVAAIVEPDWARAASAAAEWGVPVFSSVGECLEARARGEFACGAASVCTPTSAHAEVAEALLAAGLDVLVEKPIAATTKEADRLVGLAARQARILQTGHLERFNPAITATEPILNHPMFFEAHRLSVFSPRSLDVDVVLDLMIHDLDIVLSLVRSPIRSLQAVGLPILSPKVDIANVRIEFESGCVANFTASRVSTERVRKLRFFQPHQYVSIDYARQDLLMIDVTGAAQADPAQMAAAALAGGAGLPGLNIQKPSVSPGEPLRLEIESFLECVRTRSAPRVSGEDGRAALAVALEINAAIAAHAKRAGLDRYIRTASVPVA
ncbi:MAG TPA: Gfo/Idh/MocA family oxidoreductase [Acidobacteriaceae bacterium]|nr:Gfo/Idh/MocA family oxidoreductase [Acidobacteriaceae bacterium]